MQAALATVAFCIPILLGWIAAPMKGARAIIFWICAIFGCFCVYTMASKEPDTRRQFSEILEKLNGLQKSGNYSARGNADSLHNRTSRLCSDLERFLSQRAKIAPQQYEDNTMTQEAIQNERKAQQNFQDETDAEYVKHYALRRNGIIAELKAKGLPIKESTENGAKFRMLVWDEIQELKGLGRQLDANDNVIRR